jgi:hypothetical protein
MDLQHLTHNWRTTLQSILTTTFAITGCLMTASIIKPHTAALLVTVNGLCKVILGVLQTDATPGVDPTLPKT